MRIAMMTNNYKPFVGGVPISIERLADSLRDLGHTVYIFAPDYKSPMDDDEYTFRFPTMKHKIAGAIPIPNLIYSYVKKTISTLDSRSSSCDDRKCGNTAWKGISYSRSVYIPHKI